MSCNFRVKQCGGTLIKTFNVEMQELRVILTDRTDGKVNPDEIDEVFDRFKSTDSGDGLVEC